MKRRPPTFVEAKFRYDYRYRAQYRAEFRRDGNVHGLRRNPNAGPLGEPSWRCSTPNCRYTGWGPMLRDIVWNRYFEGKRFQCEHCMRRTMGRPLGPYDMRDCLMNFFHPAFYPHGMIR